MSSAGHCGCEGSCPACRSGEVENHKCNRCGREFCSNCHGIKSGAPSASILSCSCTVEMKCLEGLFEKARKVVMTPEDRRKQAISFAYGNIAIGNSSITRMMVEEAYDRLVREGLITP